MLTLLTIGIAVTAICRCMAAALVLVSMHRRWQIRISLATVLIVTAVQHANVLRHVYQAHGQRHLVLHTSTVVMELIAAVASLAFVIFWLQDLHREVTQNASVGPPQAPR